MKNNQFVKRSYSFENWVTRTTAPFVLRQSREFSHNIANGVLYPNPLPRSRERERDENTFTLVNCSNELYRVTKKYPNQNLYNYIVIIIITILSIPMHTYYFISRSAHTVQSKRGLYLPHVNLFLSLSCLWHTIQIPA